MWPRNKLLWSFIGIVLLVCLAGKATAEILSQLLPEGVPGYDTDPGVTVETRLHPDQMPLGLRDGPLVASPLLDESIGYNSNALPGPYRRGSWQVVTSPTLSLATDWSRDAIGAMLSIQDTRTLALPAQSHTDGTASVGGRLDLGEDQLSIAAAHIAHHEDRGEVDTVASDRPVAFQIDDLRASYITSSGPWSIAPEIEVSNWTYDPTTVLGNPADQSYRDRVVAQGGVTLRYELAPLHSLLFLMRALGQDYTRTPANQISPNSVSYQMLAGIDYVDDTVWHWRLLLGAESRHFAAAAYTTQNNLIAEAGVGWQPSGMTSVDATISRESDDAAQEGVSGLIYTSARLTIDHEYLRNLLLKASIGWQEADFFQGGHQTSTSAGVGMTWVMNRSMHLSFTYDQTDQQSARLIGGATAAGFSRGLGMVTLRMGL
jgi:hypothetical protein